LSIAIYGKQMKIALIHHQYVSRGGMERYLVDLVKGFSEAGDEVILLTSKVDPKTPYLGRCRVVRNNVSLVPKPLRKVFFSGKLSRILERLKCDLSLSVTRSIGQDMVICGGTHIGYLKHINRKPGLLDRLEISLERNCYDTTPVMVAHSRMMQNELETLYGIDSARIKVIYPPLDEDKFYPALKNDRANFRGEFGLDKSKFVLLFVSTGHKRKGLEMVLEAVRMLPPEDFQLAIAGSRPDMAINDDRVKYLGYVTDMPRLYAAADATLMPSQYEPFGLAAVESVQCGTPVILSHYVGAGELMGDGEAYKMAELTSECLKRIILEAVENRLCIEYDFARKAGLILANHVENLKSCRSGF
jgi:glycosyltransferase involved in cell wall biosynthesis